VVIASELTALTERTQIMDFLWLLPVLPLAAATINLFFGKRLGRFAGWLATGAMAAAAVLSAMLVRDLLAQPAEERLLIVHLFDWIRVGAFDVGATLRLDAVSAVMILVVTGVGTLIHLYAIGYMEGDPRYGRFFAYMNLFVFFMLTLVLGENLLVLYLGWEGVGLCSYLLIGFWFDKTENANAAKKAFITTRIGDTALMIGLAVIVLHFGTLDYQAIFAAAPSTLTEGAATAIALLLFAGAIGKSAQVPLHVWLPDAMAGPTPVSALIHAATMVTAGVYLCVRMSPVFELSEIALTVVLVVGLFTAIFAATAALGQFDIKRVLAYSTISQLGFMFTAVGMRAYAAAMFMLVAHALYKALMFLGAGSVMHGTHEETDMRKLGGLWRPMPATTVTFLVGAAAQAGIPFLAGFYAKDAILEIAQHTQAPVVYILASFGAFLSALYIGRMVWLTFFGAPRSDQAAHAHESPAVMTIPLVLLALGALGGGYLNTTPEGRIGRLLEPVIGAPPKGPGLEVSVLWAIAIAITASALLFTWYVYLSGRVDVDAWRERLQPLPRTLRNGWYVDRAYEVVFQRPGQATAGFLASVVDLRWIDGLVNAVGGAVKSGARAGRKIQTGYVRSYAAALLLGAVALMWFLGWRA
jgi:NADH-quinone oxidoreductase subunit L